MQATACSLETRHESQHNVDSDTNTLRGGQTHGNKSQNKRWARRYLGSTSVSTAIYDGVHLVYLGGDLKVIDVSTSWQHGELLARGEAVGI